MQIRVLKKKKSKQIVSLESEDKEYRPVLQERKMSRKESTLMSGLPTNFTSFKSFSPLIRSRPGSRPMSSNKPRNPSIEPSKTDFLMITQGSLVEVKSTLHQYHQDENRVVYRPFSAAVKSSQSKSRPKSFLPSDTMCIKELSSTMQKLAHTINAAPSPIGISNINSRQRHRVNRERDGISMEGPRHILSYQSNLNILFI